MIGCNRCPSRPLRSWIFYPIQRERGDACVAPKSLKKASWCSINWFLFPGDDHGGYKVRDDAITLNISKPITTSNHYQPLTTDHQNLIFSKPCVQSVVLSQFWSGELLVQLPAAAAVSVSMDDAPPEESLAALENWWLRHPRSSIRLAAKLVFQREQFGPYIDMLYPLDQIYAPWLWPEEDLKFLPPKMIDSALARKEALEKAYEDLKSEGLSKVIPRDLFLRAHHAAASRAFAGEAKGYAKICKAWEGYRGKGSVLVR